MGNTQNKLASGAFAIMQKDELVWQALQNPALHDQDRLETAKKHQEQCASAPSIWDIVQASKNTKD